MSLRRALLVLSLFVALFAVGILCPSRQDPESAQSAQECCLLPSKRGRKTESTQIYEIAHDVGIHSNCRTVWRDAKRCRGYRLLALIIGTLSVTTLWMIFLGSSRKAVALKPHYTKVKETTHISSVSYAVRRDDTIQIQDAPPLANQVSAAPSPCDPYLHNNGYPCFIAVTPIPPVKPSVTPIPR